MMETIYICPFRFFKTSLFHIFNIFLTTTHTISTNIFFKSLFIFSLPKTEKAWRKSTPFHYYYFTQHIYIPASLSSGTTSKSPVKEYSFPSIQFSMIVIYPSSKTKSYIPSISLYQLGLSTSG